MKFVDYIKLSFKLYCNVYRQQTLLITLITLITNESTIPINVFYFRDKEINKNRNILIKTLEIIKNISKRMDDLKTHKETDEAKLKKIKEVSFSLNRTSLKK